LLQLPQPCPPPPNMKHEWPQLPQLPHEPQESHESQPPWPHCMPQHCSKQQQPPLAATQRAAKLTARKAYLVIGFPQNSLQPVPCYTTRPRLPSPYRPKELAESRKSLEPA